MTSTPDFSTVPTGSPVLSITISAQGQVEVDGWKVDLLNSDPNLTAANAAIDYARRMGHPVRVLLRVADGTTYRLIATPEMSVRAGALIPAAPDNSNGNGHGATPANTRSRQPTSPQPAPAPMPTPPAPAPPAAAPARPQRGQTPWSPEPTPPAAPAAPAISPLVKEIVTLLATRPQPPEDTDPDTVPAWPSLRITLHPDGTADVEGERVPYLAGIDVRQIAVAAAAVRARALGLSRPVRAVAVDPDGTPWPLIIHPNGSASDGGPPPPRPKRRRGRG